MSRKRVEGYWDCEYCGTKGIGGLTKTCPNCGHPQAQGLKFYVKKGPQKYLEPEVAKDYGKGADWVCAYCGSYNRYYDVVCRNCGGDKNSSEEDYFGREVMAEEKEVCTSEDHMPDSDKEEHSSPSCEEQSSDDEKTTYTNIEDYHKHSSFSEIAQTLLGSMKYILAIGGGISLVVALIMLLVTIFTPKEYTATISDKQWSKSITIQVLKTFDESDWDVPAGARVYDERREIRDYDKVIDHYDIEEYTVSHREIDYYDTEYQDNGDGTFDEVEVPVYKTVYETETKKVPVYVNVPIYDTKYYYEIDRWCYGRTETSSGKQDTPYWPEVTLSSKERECSRSETYTIYLQTEEKTYSTNVSYEEWKDYELNTKVYITVVAGIVTEVVVD